MRATQPITSPEAVVPPMPAGQAGKRLCPCLNSTAVHIGGCLFAGTAAGNILGGLWGAVAGAVFGLLVGTAAVMSNKLTATRGNG